ncbi:MAG TPA: sigma-70 family RNA polymerase sigma factor [Thermoanaerobaculia bacterium]
MRRLRERDPETERHFTAYFSDVLRLKWGRRLSRETVEDTRQESFRRTLAIIYRGELREGNRLGAYVNSVAENVVKEGFRKDGRTEPLGPNFDPVSQDDSARLAEQNETQRRVRRTLDKLDQREAAILKAVWIDEDDKDEICRRFGITRDYLRVVLHRAKQHFRDELGEN